MLEPVEQLKWQVGLVGWQGQSADSPVPTRLTRPTCLSVSRQSPSAFCTGRSEKLNSTASSVASCATGFHEGTTKMSRACHGNRCVADRLCAAPFDHVVDRGVGRSRRRAVKAARQELQKRADRRHRIAAGRRVHELHLDAVAGMKRAASVHASSVSRLRAYGYVNSGDDFRGRACTRAAAGWTRSGSANRPRPWTTGCMVSG